MGELAASKTPSNNRTENTPPPTGHTVDSLVSASRAKFCRVIWFLFFSVCGVSVGLHMDFLIIYDRCLLPLWSLSIHSPKWCRLNTIF